MEWMNRGDRQGQPTGQQASPAPAQASAKQKVNLRGVKSWKIAQVALLFCVTILVVAVVWFVALGGSNKESSYVDKSKLQAVFLNGGQVYFGNIKDLNGKFLSMKNIYYLRVNQQVQPNQSNSSSSNDISLVKLGCELHGPQDTMVINREQVIFWENLKDNGQVAEAVKNYKEANPGEQKCEQTTGNSTNTNATTESNTGTNTTTGTGTNNSSNTNSTSNNSNR